ncbi:MAG: rhamnulokinase, partial [Planctomycetota bacterium]
MPEDFQAIAVDCGASNGRAVVGVLSADGRLEVHDIRRFPNEMMQLADGLHWDFDRLTGEVRAAVDDALGAGFEPRSVGIDTWGVDYVIVGEDGRPVGQPFAYRDSRTDGVTERLFAEVISPEELYAITGIQFMSINTLIQLASEVFDHSERLESGHRILMMPDALACQLSGTMVAEATIASTSQMLDARTRTWSDELIGRLGLRRDLLPDIVEPGTVLGKCRTEPSSGDIDVVATAGHDTASAVAAVPAEGGAPWAYVSSGTWSLVGVETNEPLLTDKAREVGVTNEGGVDATYRLLRNITGLWLLQECMRIWEARGRKLTIQEVCAAAAEAPSDGPLVDPDDPSFLAPKDMPAAITDFCSRTGQSPPESASATARCVFESLALKTRVVIDRIAALTRTEPEVIHMVGGGSKNGLLCRMTADAAARPVIAGPSEATAIGNLLVQAKAAGRIGSLTELRQIVRSNVEPLRYEPLGADTWR